MEKPPFERFILENLYNVWKEHGTSKVTPLQALIEEYGFKEKNISKPLKRLISAGLVDADSYSAWITKKGIAKMDSISHPGESAAIQGDKASDSIGINFLKNFEQAISKSELPALERETWLNGIKQISHNPVLLKAVEVALKSTIDSKPS
ncbi:MAG: hypothetical protein ACYSWS_02175 [Planctomycetota bacterium]|jgi:hypothetical protein